MGKNVNDQNKMAKKNMNAKIKEERILDLLDVKKKFIKGNERMKNLFKVKLVLNKTKDEIHYFLLQIFH